jgi:hypothetical protein
LVEAHAIACQPIAVAQRLASPDMLARVVPRPANLRRSGLGLHGALSLALSALACAGGAQHNEPPLRLTPQRASPDVRAAEPAASRALPSPAAEAVTLVTDPEALSVIAARGGEFAQLALSMAGSRDNAALWRDDAYRALMNVTVRDVQAIAAKDPQAGVAIRGHAHRLFDVRWLRSRAARFVLVAVVNRMDRHAFDPSGCGELRFVYRLAYRQQSENVLLASRLPMTLALELHASAEAGAPCREVAQRWLLPRGLTGRALGEHLTAAAGPLSPRSLGRDRIARVVSNVQAVRWPSAVRPDLGGHAEYVLRAFTWDGTQQRFVVRKLENTPDVPRLERDAAQREALAQWLSDPEHLSEVDAATARLPDRFLAESVVSVTPRGLSRGQNRPFRRLLTPARFAAVDLSRMDYARSPEALLRRLDDLTCSGCHQSRSIAGFHLLGDDPLDTAPGNALFTGSSPHTSSDQARRRAYVEALARGQPTELARPLAERAERDEGGYGAHCGLGDPGFAHWTCAAGLRCDAYEASWGEDTVGVCLPERASTGDPCEPDRVQRVRDGVVHVAERTCDGLCEATRVGFPGGMCASSCGSLGPEASCGSIALLTPFNDCLARARPFAECARDHVRPAGLRSCSDGAPCRDDYVCTKTSAGGGTCLPPYFVFQMRVDGHPTPL